MARAASSMVRCVNKATIASSCLRPSFAPWPIILMVALRRHFIASEPRRLDLLSRATGGIHVMTAVIPNQGENIVTSMTEQPETAPAEPKADKKATGRARRANVAPKKAKSGKKANPAKK